MTGSALTAKNHWWGGSPALKQGGSMTYFSATTTNVPILWREDGKSPVTMKRILPTVTATTPPTDRNCLSSVGVGAIYHCWRDGVENKNPPTKAGGIQRCRCSIICFLSSYIVRGKIPQSATNTLELLKKFCNLYATRVKLITRLIPIDYHISFEFICMCVLIVTHKLCCFWHIFFMQVMECGVEMRNGDEGRKIFHWQTIRFL